jgi:TPP-dependent pyruvate/acetoin dehydrogenase alpha subunit
MLSDSAYYQSLYRIRRFEETVLENFPRGIFYGTTHTYLGQEANAVGVISPLNAEDVIFSNHRCHGHFLAYGGDARRLFAELMGRSTGVCGGRGGSQHLQWRNFYSNGVQGGIVPVATGMALAEKARHSGAVTVAFLGDGTLGEGVVYEALNMAALWGLPILYVLENNGIAQTTPIERAFAGFAPEAMAARLKAFGIEAREIDTSDVLEIAKTVAPLIDAVRQESKPQAVIIHTQRFGPHSKGDDTRPVEWVEQMRASRDPVKIQAARLKGNEVKKIEKHINAEIKAAFEQALEDPLPVLFEKVGAR